MRELSPSISSKKIKKKEKETKELIRCHKNKKCENETKKETAVSIRVLSHQTVVV